MTAGNAICNPSPYIWKKALKSSRTETYTETCIQISRLHPRASINRKNDKRLEPN